MTPDHVTDLIERCRTTPAGRLEAWSIQGRYGMALFAFGVGLALLSGHLIHTGSQAGGLWPLAGFAAFALLFGVAIGRLRATLRVDDTGIELESRSAFRTQRWHAPRTAAERVLLREIRESDSNGTEVYYDLLLEAAVEEVATQVRFFRARAEAPARRMGAEVGRALRLPFVDAIGDEEEEITPDPHSLRRSEPSSQGDPMPGRIREDLQSGAPSLVIEGTLTPQISRRLLIAGGAFFAMASLGGWGIGSVMDPFWLGWAILFPFWGASFFFLAEGWLGRQARERVSLAQGAVVREVELFGRRWRCAEVEVDALRSIRVQAESPKARGVALVGDERVLVVGTGLENDACDWLRGWLAGRIG